MRRLTQAQCHKTIDSRRDAREAEGAPLLREYRVKSLIEGSNPLGDATSEAAFGRPSFSLRMGYVVCSIHREAAMADVRDGLHGQAAVLSAPGGDRHVDSDASCW